MPDSSAAASEDGNLNTPAGPPTVGSAGVQSDPIIQVLAELRAIRETQTRTAAELASIKFSQLTAEGRFADVSTRLETLERVRDSRAPSPETVFPDLGAAKQETPTLVRFSAQDARSGYQDGATSNKAAHGSRDPPPHMGRRGAPDVSISRIPSALDDSLAVDRSLSQRLLDPAIPDSDRVKLLEQDYAEQAAAGGRRVNNDDLWRTAFDVVRRDAEGKNVSRPEILRRVQDIVYDQALKSAAAGTALTNSTRKKTESSERRINLSGVNKIVSLEDDNFDAWETDLWSFLQSYPKARAMLFQDSCMGYDHALDEELGGLIGLTVGESYKNKVLRQLRRRGETRGTQYLAELTREANRDSESRKTLLRQKLLATTQKAGEGMRAYADRHQAIARQLSNIDETLTDREMVNFLLKNLHPSIAGLRDALFAAQAAAGRNMSYNEVVSFMLTMEEMRSLYTMTTASNQPLGRFSARHVSAEHDSDEATATTLDLNQLSEEEAVAYVARFHQQRRSGSPGPPPGHPQAAEWFPGECNLCGNIGHREARCKLRARLLDGSGPGPRYEHRAEAKHAVGDLTEEEVKARLVELFPAARLDAEAPVAKVAKVLSANLE
ncbi:hypothetical protein OC842_007381 [Tilletia horrida]|uniref:Uncharacterized protein n=1 Tax=Tilletia horrida TaxID=155126 RepID=A0AAN6G406_9BASI|nr:hypothetical protein OC842_007381 [Tilletia horrida]